MKFVYLAIGILVIFGTLSLMKGGIQIPSSLSYAQNQSQNIPVATTTPTENVLEKIIAAISQASTTPPEKVLLDVPFTAQAPFGNWADARQDYGCEEASLLMAVYWANGEKLTPEIALEQIKAMSNFEVKKFGDYHDTSITDTLTLLKTYLNYDNAFVKFDVNAADIKNELANGNLVIVPIDGRKVGNKYYVPPGPFRHQIVIKGYDDATGEFIANDPGTLHGESYRYGYKTLESALMDYPTGFNEPVKVVRSAMLVVEK